MLSSFSSSLFNTKKKKNSYSTNGKEGSVKESMTQVESRVNVRYVGLKIRFLGTINHVDVGFPWNLMCG
jgi:hypothetical protein